MSTRGWSYEQFFNHHFRAVYGFDCASFMTRVRNQAGEYEERFEPIFENLSAQQAAQVLRHADRDGLELPVSRRESLKKAASRSRELERHYDNMDPQVAWAELCSKTGVVEATEFSPHPFNASTKEMASMLLYEAQTLLPDEHVSGLIRASHLLVNGGTIPGPHRGWNYRFLAMYAKLLRQ